MKDKLIGWRHAPPLRIALLLGGAVAATGIVALGVTADIRNMAIVAALLAFAAFILIDMALARVPYQVALRELPAVDRLKAVSLAWEWAPAERGTARKWAAYSAGVSLALYVVSLNTTPSLPWVVLAAVLPPALVLVRQHFFEHRRRRVLALRASGVDYVRGMYPAWLAKGAELIGEATMARFQQTDPSRRPFVFWLPRFEAVMTPDMPTPYVDYESIAVGEFLGARGGPVIDLQLTSIDHARTDDPDTVSAEAIAINEDVARVEEREAHYKDVITVDYKRSGGETTTNESMGVFQVTLTNGQTMAFPTLEHGPPVQAALENIRARTRRAKGA